MSRLCRYVGGLACLVTVLALAACGAGLGSTTQADAKVIGNIAFQQGETIRRIPLVDKFTGKDLTYTATSDKPSVATATVDNDADILTVTAVGAGTATITVTAKNPKGEAKQSFTVTVPTAPMEIPDFPSLEEDATRTIRLGDKFSGENLTYDASSSNVRVATATVDNTADTLTVTAVGPGTATITVTATAQGSAPQTKTFTVTVPQPASEEEAPTVRTGAITSVDVAQGGAQTVTLSTVFDGANLSYAVSSSATAVATASESNGTLTIRGVSVGPATVTVTATNTAGSSPAHAIAVTVTAPVTTSSGTLTIKRGESAKRTLSAGQTLKSPDVTAVAVEPSGTGAGNVWIITAIKKGTYTITIFNGDGTSQSRGIVVVIPNSLPLRLHENPPGTELPNPVTVDVDPVTNGRFVTRALALGTYFEDPDPDDDDDELRYKVGNKLPPWILMDAKTGFATLHSNELRFEILDKQLLEDRKFTVTLYAVDDSGGTSQRPVVLELTAPTDGEPAESNYTVRQAPNGDLNREGTLRVGPRMVSGYHALTFMKAAEGHAGFRFASLKAASLVKAGDLFLVDNGDVDTITASSSETIYVDGDPGIPEWVKDDPGATPPIVGNNVNLDYYLLKFSGDVEARWNTTAPALDEDPKIDFRLTGTGRGTITIEYHVWKYTGSEELTDVMTIKGNAADRVTESISLDIVTCNSPPDPLSDCPGAP